MDLNNKVAVITGGASGLGRATAEMVINQGGKVALFDLNQDLVAQTAKELGPNASVSTVNVTEEESVEAAVTETMVSRAHRPDNSVRVRSRSAGVSTPRGTDSLASSTSMSMPLSSRRSCSRDSVASSSLTGKATKRASAQTR